MYVTTSTALASAWEGLVLLERRDLAVRGMAGMVLQRDCAVEVGVAGLVLSGTAVLEGVGEIKIVW